MLNRGNRMRGLRALQRSQTEIEATAKSVSWKLALAEWMKTTTQATNGWPSGNLKMGAPAALGRNLTQYCRKKHDSDPQWQRLISISAT